MTSLEIVNEMVDYWESAVNVACQSNAENGYYDELDIVEYQNRLKKYQQIKQDLEILQILIKWKDFINIEQDYEYLLNDEIKLFDSDIKLLNTYLRHHINSYIPISFRKVGDSQ